MKRVLSAIALAFALVLAAPVLAPQTAVVAEAATKTEAYLDTSEIGVNGTSKIRLSNKKSKASYTFSSSKKSVATVSKKGVVTGQKAGTAKITVKQKYKGKTTKIATLTIKVKKAEIQDWIQYEGLYYTAQPGYYKKNPVTLSVSESDLLFYENPKAKYTFSSDSADLVISKGNKVTEVKKSGKVNLIVKETYKGKTRTVGKIPVTLRDPAYTGEDIVELALGVEGSNTFDVNEHILALGMYNFALTDTKQSEEEAIRYANAEDDEDDADDANKAVEIVRDSDGKWHGEIRAVGYGTRYGTITQYNYLTGKYDKVVAQFTIVVLDASKLTSFRIDWESEVEWDDAKYDSATNTLEENLSYEYRTLDIIPTPKVYSGSYEVTSSNPDVVQAEVTYNEFVGGYSLELKYLKAGTATITLSAGGMKETFNVKVVDDSE